MRHVSCFLPGLVISASCPPTHTVLVVDDEAGVREALRVILDREYRVLTADSGETALEILRQEEISVVTLDLRMPGWGGIETLLRIRDVSPHVGVVLITAYGSETEAMRALRLDACDLVTKPFATSEVLAAVRCGVERREERLRSPSRRAPRSSARLPSSMRRLCANGDRTRAPGGRQRYEEAGPPTQKPSNRDGELGLLWAIFDDGIQTYCREVLRGTTSSLDYREVERWVFRSGADALTSFGNLCELFGIDPSRMRAALVQLREQPDESMVSRLMRSSA